MRKVLIVLLLAALAPACNAKPTREQCVEYTAALASEVMELRSLYEKSRSNNRKAMELIQLLKARADRNEKK
jgi:hypothetical protein